MTYLRFLYVRIKMCNSSVILKNCDTFFQSVTQRNIRHHGKKHTERRSTLFDHCMASAGSNDNLGVIYPLVVFIGHVLMSLMLLFPWMS